jgi:hypothetical protein
MSESTKPKTRRSTWSGILKNLDGSTIGYIYLYPTSPKKEEEGQK